MKKFKVKVCGIARTSDANLIAELGGDLIGLIFYRKSPRSISIPLAREIINNSPTTLQRVGLFVDETPDRILSIANKLRLDYIQLHGSESPNLIRQIQKEGFRVIKSFAICKAEDIMKIKKSPADLYLLDNKTESLIGGTGKQFDWGIRPKQKLDKLVLAGGITAGNLADGVRLFDPQLIDVNSGVEVNGKPGIKSPTKLKKFFKKADKIRYGS